MSAQERPTEGKAEKRPSEPEPAVDVPEAVRERVRADQSPVRCPFCHDDVRVGEQRWVACAGCLARHHSSCWGEGGRCGACGDVASLAGSGGTSRTRDVVSALVVVAVLVGIGLVLAGLQALRLEVLAQREVQLTTSTPSPPPPYPGETPAVAALRVAAHGGDARAAHDLAVALDEGRDVVPNQSEALRWYVVSADRGDPRAMKALAAALAVGRLGLGDQAQAIFWYRRALQADYDPATVKALTYNLSHDDPERRQWIERLALEGDVEALLFVGQVERAYDRLRDAAERGDPDARQRLYRLYESGTYESFWGLEAQEPRPDEARAALDRWAAAGDEWAKKVRDWPSSERPGTGVLTFDEDGW